MISADHKRCSTRPSVDRPNYDLAKVFFVALRGQKEVAVAVAVLRGPPCPPWTNVLPLQFFVVPSWTKGSCSRRCSSPRPSVSSVDKCAAVAVLRGPSWAKEVAVAVAVLRGPPCPPWTNVLPLQFFVVLRGQKEVAVAVAVLRGPPCPPWTNVLPLQFFVALRGQKEVAVAVAVLRGPPCPPWTNVLPLQFFVVLRGQKEVAVAVAVLRGPPCPPWTNVLPLQFFVALRGQKEVAVAVAVLRGPPCPPWTNVLPLQFFVVLRGQKKLQSPLQFSAALRVLRGQMCCRCSSSWPFVDKRKLQSPLQFSAALRVLRGQMCCRCSSSWSFVGKRSCSRRCPSWTKGSCSRRCSSPRPSVSSVDKCVAVAVLRGPSWSFVEKGSPPSPFEDRPNYDLAYLSSDKRQRALVTPPVRGISLSPLPYPLPPAVLAFEAGLRPCEPIRR